MPTGNDPHYFKVKDKEHNNLFQNTAAPEFCGFGGERRIRFLIISSDNIFGHVFCIYNLVIIQEEATRMDNPWLYEETDNAKAV